MVFGPEFGYDFEAKGGRETHAREEALNMNEKNLVKSTDGLTGYC